MKITENTTVTVKFNATERQHLARILNGYYKYRESQPMKHDPDEDAFARDLEKVALDYFGFFDRSGPKGYASGADDEPVSKTPPPFKMANPYMKKSE